MRKYIISEVLLNEILSYLGNQPYINVFSMIQKIQSHCQNKENLITDEQILLLKRKSEESNLNNESQQASTNTQDSGQTRN